MAEGGWGRTEGILLAGSLLHTTRSSGGGEREGKVHVSRERLCACRDE